MGLACSLAAAQLGDSLRSGRSVVYFRVRAVVYCYGQFRTFAYFFVCAQNFFLYALLCFHPFLVYGLLVVKFFI